MLAMAEGVAAVFKPHAVEERLKYYLTSILIDQINHNKELFLNEVLAFLRLPPQHITRDGGSVSKPFELPT